MTLLPDCTYEMRILHGSADLDTHVWERGDWWYSVIGDTGMLSMAFDLTSHVVQFYGDSICFPISTGIDDCLAIMWRPDAAIDQVARASPPGWFFPVWMADKIRELVKTVPVRGT